tara:strand:- start:1677 stop:3038 length:1362 start_codon:yes stop_codon:yes gene_type:complete
MAADNTLVQGAYKAAGGGRTQADPMFDAIDNINKDINEKFVKPEQKRRSDAKANAQKAADDILANGGSMNSQTYDALYPQVQRLQEEYYQAVLKKDDQSAAKIMMQMNQMSQSIQSGKEIATQNATALTDGLASDAMTAEELRNANAIHDPNAQHIFGKDEQGNPTHKVLVNNEDGSTQELDFDQISKSMILKDNESKKSLNDIALKELQNASKGIEWNQNAAQLQIRNIVDSSKNLRSLMHDQMIGGSSDTKFVNAIAKNPDLVGLNYADLDASQFPLEEGETNWDDNISEADQAMIVDAITNPSNEFYNEDLSKNLVVDYFTNYAKQQHGGSFKDKEKKSTQERQRAPISASEMNKYNSFVSSFNKKGKVFMPDGTYAEPDGKGGYTIKNAKGATLEGLTGLTADDLINKANLPNSLRGKLDIKETAAVVPSEVKAPTAKDLITKYNNPTT